MNLYTTRRLLWLASTVLAGGVIAVAAYALLWPIGVVGQASATASPAAGLEDPEGWQALPLQHYAVIWQRDLRRSLYDLPPVVARAKPKSKLKARLTGTIVEPGFTYALFTTSKGKTVRRRVGEKIGEGEDAEVKSISEGSVTVLFAGETLTLKVEGKKGR